MGASASPSHRIGCIISTPARSPAPIPERGSGSDRAGDEAVDVLVNNAGVLGGPRQGDGIIVCPVHPGWVRTDMGGSQAEISPQESAAGLFDLIESMTMAHSGRFWTWRGEEHPW